MTGGRAAMDWRAWHRDYDDPDSSVSRRLVEVRSRLAAELDTRSGVVRLLSLCAGDSRDAIPVVASSRRDVELCLVELDPGLAEDARRTAAEAEVEVDVRAADAATPATYADRLPVDVLMLVGVLGNVSEADGEATIAAAASMLRPGGTVIWTRSNRVRTPPTHTYADPAEWVRDRFEAHRFETLAWVAPDGMAWRLGVSRLAVPSAEPLPERLFTFVR